MKSEEAGVSTIVYDETIRQPRIYEGHLEALLLDWLFACVTGAKSTDCFSGGFENLH